MKTQNENTEQVTNRRGRPNKNLVWPNETFSADDVFVQMNKTLSKVSIHAKINKAVAAGELVLAGFAKASAGRPKSMYKKSV